jgi:hypothetical protein
MRIKHLASILALTATINATAETQYHLLSPASNPQVTDLKQGTAAPFSGILFGYKEEAQIRKDSEMLPIVQQRVDLYQNEITALHGQVDLWKDQAQSNAKVAVSNSDYNLLKIGGGFVVGSLVTILLFNLAKGLAK